MAQRPSPTPRGPQDLRTSSADSDPPLHQRPITDRTPKLGVVDRRSPRSTHSEPLRQKKLGTRITDLETQLVQAQHELKSLKQQLASAEFAKKQAQEELHGRKGSKKQTTTRKVQSQVPQDIHGETDVFEVPIEETKRKSLDSAISKPEYAFSCDELASTGAKIEDEEKKIQVGIEENETLKQQIEEAKLQIASARSKEEKMESKLNHLEQELEVSKSNTAKLEEKILEVEGEKESLEAEMKKMKVQTEQWRKAADEAAAVIRSVSMDKQFNGIFEQPINGYVGSSLSVGDDIYDVIGGGKKKGSGIRMLGDLLKKKGQK